MKILASLRRPEYMFRPSQIIRRLASEFRSVQPIDETVLLPWGLPIKVHPTEVIGSSIRRLGIHDLSGCECIWRLIDLGDRVVDVGANVGQMTSLMSVRSGPRGEVLAFEPHPRVFHDLMRNISTWQQSAELAKISASSAALSDHEGTAPLIVPRTFGANNGIARLGNGQDTKPETEKCEVPVTRLDTVAAGLTIGLLKIDVEGHELQVLKGAEKLLNDGHIRDILFEDFSTPPTPVSLFLESHGYTVYRISNTLLGPNLLPASTPFTEPLPDAPNYLATLEPQRAAARIGKRGWAIYAIR
jgi:FkbM family methyltransferase